MRSAIRRPNCLVRPVSDGELAITRQIVGPGLTLANELPGQVLQVLAQGFKGLFVFTGVLYLEGITSN